MFGAQEQEITLPKIREDIKLMDSEPAEDGTKQWMLFDPIQNKYFIIGIDTFDLINLWEDGISSTDFLQKLEKNDYELDEEGLSTFINFLNNSGLSKSKDANDAKKLYEQKQKAKQSPFKWLIHNYLFIKIPIFKPDKWLTKNYNKIDFMYSKIWNYLILTIGLIGILLVIQDWENFSSTFMYLFSSEGMMYYFLSLVFVKSFHELGHAFTAKRYGCKIPSMGVAFLVMFPVLYTDTTNAYALKSKYMRLRIALAGMKVEIYLAMIATFLWSFLPEGPLKSIAFIIATTSWITSLLVNISPFLRFDGYYVLSDWTNTKNLQPRSFAMAKWFVRKYIFGLEEVEPENMSISRKRFFIIYAIGTWIYRFFLFLSIAFLVYYFAFKVLGIILFLVEIIWFIFMPVFKELKYWFEKRSQVSFNKRNIVSLVVASLILFALLVPWSSKVYMPAVLVAEDLTDIYSPKNGFIKDIFVKNAQIVKKGDLLLEIESEELDFNIKKVKKELEILNIDLNKINVNKDLLNNRFVLEENFSKMKKELEGLYKLRDSLKLKAPFSGTIYFNDDFKIKQYVNKKEAILTIYNNRSSKVVGFCEDVDYQYLNEYSNGKFISNIPNVDTIEVFMDKVSNISLVNLEYEELSSVYGGKIATRQSQEKNQKALVSEKAYFKVEAKIENLDINFKTRVVGELIVESEKSSFVTKIWKKLYNVLVRESSF